MAPEAGYLLIHFPTRAKARAMQHWIDRSGIASRPMPAPFNGPQMRVGVAKRPIGGATSHNRASDCTRC
jgi:hypothetical protein